MQDVATCKLVSYSVFQFYRLMLHFQSVAAINSASVSLYFAADVMNNMYIYSYIY